MNDRQRQCRATYVAKTMRDKVNVCELLILSVTVAVVVAFFMCWAPFHAQRLMTLYIEQAQWTPELLTVQSHLFYVSGNNECQE